MEEPAAAIPECYSDELLEACEFSLLVFHLAQDNFMTRIDLDTLDPLGEMSVLRQGEAAGRRHVLPEAGNSLEETLVRGVISLPSTTSDSRSDPVSQRLRAEGPDVIALDEAVSTEGVPDGPDVLGLAHDQGQ